LKIGDPINAEHQGFAVDDEPFGAVLKRRLDDPRVPVGPVGAAARGQAHAVAVALQPKAIAVVLISCSQSGPVGTLAPRAECKNQKA
jgi:hypothetical protein